ncbi:MAG: hypothetical protein JSW50_06565 [Candidatus Latescibacterota bacterium]|nr:MAG: hypothetical protein JSW50_06565 [Candidatus Latescibacterota bacterium]
MKTTCLGLVLILAVAPSFAETSEYDWQSWGSVVDTLRSVTRGKRVALSSPFIEAGTEKVTVAGVALEPRDYEINYQRGFLRINALLADDAMVVVSYTRLPFLLNSVYSLRPVEFAEGQQPPAIPPAPDIRESQSYFNPGGNLVFGGVKSVSFAVGSNRSAQLDQTLSATVEGDLTPSIHVKALLSDNNLPVQPEGNTQELEYLDKVYVELTGPMAGATLGDFAVANNFSDYNSFRRELKGASGYVDLGQRTRVGLAGGSSKGVFRTVQQRGIDQLQGPYELITQSIATGEVIIAGTERVYFNGEILLRGEDRDYTIDYDRGTITFTPRRPVTADTEIAVDFEVTQEQYHRGSVFGHTNTQAMPGGFKFSVLAAREQDDKDRPKSVVLDDEDRGILAEAGDDPTEAISSGVTFVGGGNGQYIKVPADTLAGTPEYYVFDDTLGAYNLIFVDVGGLRGDYILEGVSLKGNPVYRFTGENGGNFVIGKKLPLPQSHVVYTTRLVKESAHVDFDIQYNMSDFDANTFSVLDDDDNIGDAGEARLRVKDVPALLGRLSVGGSVSTLGQDFRSLDRARRWYFYTDWNLEGEELTGREVIEELSSTFTRNQSIKLDYMLGRIKRDDFRGLRQEARALLARGEDRKITGRVFETDVDGTADTRLRQHADVSASFGMWGLLPAAEYEFEEYVVSSPVLPDSGIAFDRYLVRLGSRQSGRFSYSFHAEERNTDQLADTTDGWVYTRQDRTYGALVTSRSLRAVQGELQFTHRERDNKTTGGGQTSDLARLKMLFRLDRLGVNSNVDYEISQNQAVIQRRGVVFVGEGQGDYNALGDPVGKGRGAYTVVFLPTTITIPSQSVGLTWNFNWKPGRSSTGKSGGGLFGWLGRNMSLAQSLNVREQSTAEKAYKIYLLFPSALQRDDTTLNGIVSLRQEWSFFDAYPNFSVTYRYERNDEEENRFNGINEDRFFEQHTLRVDRSLSRIVSVNVEARREARQLGRRGLVSGIGGTYDVRGQAAAVGWGLRFGSGNSLDGEFEVRKRRDAESTAEELALSFKPRAVWRPIKSLNVFVTYEVTRFSTDVVTVSKPVFFSNPGMTHRWGLTPNLRLSKIISLLGNYQGRSEETFSGKRIVDHEFTMETRAYF